MTSENTEEKLSDYEMSLADVAMRDMMRAAEAERAARQAYQMERAAREAYDAERATREELARRQLIRDATSHVTAGLAHAISDSRTLRMMRAIEDSPAVRMMREFENAPAVRLMRDMESSPAMRMMRDLERSPALELSRSIAESLMTFHPLTRPSIVTAMGGPLADARVLADFSGIAALQNWTAGLRGRDLGIAASLVTPAFDTLSALTSASRHVLEQMNVAQSFAELPPYMRVAPTLESYASASMLHLFLPEGASVDEIHVIDLLAEDMLDGVSEEFEARLASVDQDLLKPVRGAWHTAVSDTEDRVRQSAASIRFVVEEMIKQLAPRDKAETWARAAGYSKKPPRAARAARSAGKWAVQLRFIMRHVDALAAVEDSESVFGFLAEADLVDMLLLLERLNQAVHEPDAHIAERDLTLVLRRVMAFMTLLLDAYEFEEPE